MAYKRTRRINEEIRKIISKMLIEGEIKDHHVLNCKGLISVTAVDVVNDLSYAYVYISVLGAEAQPVIDGLNHGKGFVRTEVGRKIDIRHTPEIVFKMDDSIERGVNMSKLINQLNKGE
ncbi:MAG: 30S ribosome-binding factor RbfA [Filifactoraceae bacterium]